MQWVVQSGGIKGFYTVTVVSRPYYSLPQELCLTFDCFTQTVSKTTPSGDTIRIGPPIERVALEYLALLSMFARELLVPLGLRRVSNSPIVETPHYHYPPRRDRASTPPPFGINSPDFISLVNGFAQAPEDVVRPILAATKFYQSGLSLIAVDPSVAYTAFVSAIECLAGDYYYDQRFTFEEADKFLGVRHILEQISKLLQAETHVTDLKAELLRVEHFVGKKFVSFFVEFVTKEFWQVPDELYDYGSTLENWGQVLRSNILRRGAGLLDGSSFVSPLSSLVPSMSLI